MNGLCTLLVSTKKDLNSWTKLASFFAKASCFQNLLSFLKCNSYCPMSHAHLNKYPKWKKIYATPLYRRNKMATSLMYILWSKSDSLIPSEVRRCVCSAPGTPVGQIAYLKCLLIKAGPKAGPVDCNRTPVRWLIKKRGRVGNFLIRRRSRIAQLTSPLLLANKTEVHQICLHSPILLCMQSLLI